MGFLAKHSLPKNIAEDYKIGNTRIVISTDSVIYRTEEEKKILNKRLSAICLPHLQHLCEDEEGTKQK